MPPKIKCMTLLNKNANCQLLGRTRVRMRTAVRQRSSSECESCPVCSRARCVKETTTLFTLGGW